MKNVTNFYAHVEWNPRVLVLRPNVPAIELWRGHTRWLTSKHTTHGHNVASYLYRQNPRNVTGTCLTAVSASYSYNSTNLTHPLSKSNTTNIRSRWNLNGIQYNFTYKIAQYDIFIESFHSTKFGYRFTAKKWHLNSARICGAALSYFSCSCRTQQLPHLADVHVGDVFEAVLPELFRKHRVTTADCELGRTVKRLGGQHNKVAWVFMQVVQMRIWTQTSRARSNLLRIELLRICVPAKPFPILKQIKPTSQLCAQRYV